MQKDFVYAALVIALLLFVGHWFPWPYRLHRLGAYAYGVTVLLLGVGIWLLPHGYAWVVTGLLLLAAVAGAATVLAYGIDYVLVLRGRDLIHKQTGDER